MSNPYTGQVVSALRKSQLLLQGPCDSSLQRLALEEAALFQLWKAYRAFLVELSYELQLGFEPESLQVIIDSLESQGRASNEARELQLLLSASDSWLSQLLLAWGQLLQLSATSERKREGSKLIPLHNIACSGPVVFSTEVLLEWHRALGELVRRQRANLEEC